MIALTGIVLIAFPAIDLTVAGWFYDPFDGFVYKDNSLVRFVFLAVPWISRTIVAGLLIFLAVAWTIRRHDPDFARHRKAVAFLLAVAVAGPMFMVNAVFKDQWGRARPSQVEQFGGDRQFSRAAVPTDQCIKNCSFVSGHASVGFFVYALAFAWPRRRRTWLVAGTSLGLGIGLVRILQGGHFLSDVIFSGIVVYLTARGLHAMLFPAVRIRA